MPSLETTEASEIISWAEIHKDCRKLVQYLVTQPAFQGIICVSRGGLIPGAILARELNIKMIETICVESYSDNSTDISSSVKLLKEAHVKNQGAGWLIVDDLVDSGNTAEFVRASLPNARFVTLYAKAKGRPFVDHFVREFDQETWLFFPWDTALQYKKPMVKEGL